MSLTAKFDVTRLLDRVSRIVGRANKAVRPAAQAGIQEYYDEAKARVPVGQSVHHSQGGKHSFRPGNLRASVYQAFADKESSESKATYRVSYNRKKAFYGYFVEHGTSKMAAKPFVRPAYDAARQRAIAAARQRLREQYNKGR